MLSRLALLAGLVVVLVGTVTPAADTAAGASSISTLDAGVLTQLNAIRVDHGLTPLAISRSLTDAAEAHSQDMIANGYFDHTSANGDPFWKRIQSYYPARPTQAWAVGENILWAQGSPTATASMKAWMASPPHRANILDPHWRQIGIGEASSPDAPGTYQGMNVTVITTDFGAR